MSLNNDAAVRMFMNKIATEVIGNIRNDIREYLQFNIEKYTLLAVIFLFPIAAFSISPIIQLLNPFRFVSFL